MLRLTVSRGRCTGCRFCESACAFRHDREFSPAKARIRIGQAAIGDLTFNVNVCRQCTVCAPLGVCPTSALARDPVTGVLRMSRAHCPAGCRRCAEACRLDAFHDGGDGLVLCDLCDGDPECVKTCYTEALFVSEYQLTERGMAGRSRSTEPRSSA